MLLGSARHRRQLVTADDPLDLRQLDPDLHVSAQNASNAGGSAGIAVIRCQTPSYVLDHEHLVDVELAAEPPALRAVDGDRVLVVCERPPQGAQVRPVGEPPRLAEQVEDPLPPDVLLRHRARSR